MMPEAAGRIDRPGSSIDAQRRALAPLRSNDCLIAISCIESNQSLLQRDRDFDTLAGIDPRLQLVA